MDSVRGSRNGELVARCVVECGTSSFYSAIRDATDEPVLKAVAARIAADEFRHFKLFYDHLQRYQARRPMGRLRRLFVALTRIDRNRVVTGKGVSVRVDLGGGRFIQK